MLRVILSLLLICLSPMGWARCMDEADISPHLHEQLQARAAQVPYHAGLLWEVRKDGVSSYLFGTMHLHDPRHAPAMERLEPLIQAADQVFVEITKEDELGLQALLVREPGLYLITEGPSLLDRLGPEAWAKLVSQLEGRDMPPFMAARFQPWFLGLSMMVPKCALDDLKAKRLGIDKDIERTAREHGIPVHSLDTPRELIGLLAKDPIGEQVEDMRWSLMLDLPQDLSTSGVTQFYFNEETQVSLEYTMHDVAQRTAHLPTADRTRLDRLLDEMLDELIIERNRQWAEILAPQLAQQPGFVAVGALHLPGEAGLLRLMEQNGFSVRRLPLKQP